MNPKKAESGIQAHLRYCISPGDSVILGGGKPDGIPPGQPARGLSHTRITM